MLVAALLIFYVVVSVRHLGTVPVVYEDEPWQASTAWKIAQHGVFGTDLFTGLWGMDRHYYGYLPLHPLLTAGFFRVFGLGLIQARSEPVALGLVVLGLTYALGRRVAGPRAGLLAIALLVGTRLGGTTPSQPTGITLLDFARIARYDMLVPVFALSALLVLLRARISGRLLGYAGAGALTALAGLSHLYGVFWFVALLVLSLWDGARRRAMGALAAGFAVPWLLYGVYVLADPQAWRDQTRGYAPRFDLLNPHWYWANLVAERHRYGPGLGSFGWAWVLRPGFFVALVAVPVAAVWLARRANRGEREARAVLVPLLVIPALFAPLIVLKLANYTLSYLPVVAVAVSWSATAAWRRSSLPLRVALAFVLALVLAEGATRVVVLEREARRTTPYTSFVSSVRAHIPPGSRILGLHDYWFGLDSFDYRTWLVPLSRAGDESDPSRPTLTRALDDVDPDAVLVDHRMREYFATAPEIGRVVDEWLAGRSFVRSATVNDVSYGAIEIYTRPP